MDNIKKHTIYLGGGDVKDTVFLKQTIEGHASLFDRAILSTYGGDTRYTVVDNSFHITGISADKISYCCQVNYFSPCHSQNENFETAGSAYYHIMGDELVLALDETLWNVG